jgi:hypothetical protein
MQPRSPTDPGRRRISLVLLFAVLAYVATTAAAPLLHPAGDVGVEMVAPAGDSAPAPSDHDSGCGLCSLAASPVVLPLAPPLPPTAEPGASAAATRPDAFASSSSSSAQARSPPDA